MKPTSSCIHLKITSLLLLLAGALDVQANIFKTDTATMNATGSPWDWTTATGGGGTGVAASSGVVGEIDGTPTSGHLSPMALGGNVTLGGLQLDTTANGPLSISSGSTLTLDASLFSSAAGIKIVSGGSYDMTIGSGLTLKGHQAWSVGSGRTLTVSGTVTTAGAWVDFTSFAGTLGTLGNVNGILGPWATTGSGTSLKYAAVSGTVSGYTAAGGALPATGGTATVNYTVGANDTLTGGVTANTAQATGAGGWTVSAQTLTINGLMNSSSGLLTISSAVTIGANKELVLAPNANGMTFSGVIANNAGGASALTINADPAATVTLTGANTFTGNITINSGTLAANKSAATGGTGGALGNANSTSRSVTINSGATLDFLIGNVMGQLGTTTKNANPTPVIINGGTMDGDKTSELIGALTLNGGTVQCRVLDTGLNFKLSGSGKTYENGYLAFQLGGDVTVTGTSASTISGNGQDFTHAQDGLSLHAGTTTFNVADVTGDANPDLTISAAIDDVNADYGAGFPQTGALLKSGAGTMVLSGMNFYDGGTTISAGTIVAGTTDGQTIPVAGTGTGVAGPFANAAGAFGKPGTMVTLGDANTTLNNSSPTVMIGGAYTVGHPITIANQATSGTYTIGGSTDNNATYSGAITLNQPLTISQVANAGANALTISGGITAGSSSQTVTFAGPGNISVTTPIANGLGTLGMTVQSGGKVTFGASATPTYTGATIINGLLDISAIGSWTLGAQSLAGSGTINGSLATGTGSTIYPGTDGTAGTLTINNNLTLNTGGITKFDLSTSHVSGNDQIVLGGSLSLSGGVINLHALSGTASLDGGDYVLVSTVGGVSGTLPSVAWIGSQPANANLYSLAIVGNNLVLQHGSVSNPTVVATVTPATVGRYQTVTINATVTQGTYPIGTVTVDLSTIGGAVQTMTYVSGNNYTYSYTIPVGTSVGNDLITVTATDTFTPSHSGSSSPVLTVAAANVVWNGAGSGNWTDNADWLNNEGPGYVGDAVVFAGSTGLASTMDFAYSVTSVTFTNGAGSFNLSSGNTLTLTAGGVTNISTSSQILNLPISLTAAQTFNAAAGDLTFANTVNNNGNVLTITDGGHNTTNSGVISGAGGLVKSGSGTNTLTADNTYTGPTAVNGGRLAIGNGGSLDGASGGAYYGNITFANGGTLDYANSSVNSGYQFLYGSITGSGGITVETGDLLIGTNTTYTGATVVNGGLLELDGPNLATSGIYLSSGLTINNGGTVQVDIDNALAGITTAIGSLPVTINNGGVLTAKITVSGTHIRAPLTLAGGTLTDNPSLPIAPGGNLDKFGVWNLDDGVIVNGGVNPSSINANLVIPTQAGGTVFNVANGGATGGIDLNVNGILSKGASTPDTGIIKTGSGTMAFNNTANYYTNATTVSGGTLLAGADSPSGSPGAFGSNTLAIILGNATTTVSNSSPSLQINGSFNVARTIIVTNAATTGTYSIGGFADANGIFSGPVIIDEPLTISQVANTGGNGLTIGGGVTSGSGSQILSIAGPGKVSVTSLLANGSGTLGVNVLAGGNLFLSTVPTYTGVTTVNGTLDVTGLAGSTLTLGSQTVNGTGIINGSLATGTGTAIYPATDGTAGTLTINNNLTLNSGGITKFDLSTSHSSGNDQIAVTGNLTINGGTIHLNALSGASPLDGSDYVLITSSSYTGIVPSVTWDGTQPANSTSYYLHKVGNNLVLQHSSVVAPTVTVSVSPSPAQNNQIVTITATVTPGTDPVSTVTVDLSAIGGSMTQALVLVGGSGNVYTNSWTVSATTPLSTVTITATATDNLGNPGSGSTSLTLSPSTVTWNGGGSGTWSDNTDWVSNQGPGLFGSTVFFQGSVGLTSTMNNSYNLTSLTFTNGAGSFNIGTVSSTLTLSAGGVTNNSSSPETLNVPVILTAAQTLNAAAGDLTLGQSVADGVNLLTLADGGHNLAINGTISGTGGLTKNGTGTNTLSGTNTFTGPVTINAGTLAVGGSGTLNSGSYANTIVDNGTLSYNSSTNQILSGVISGTGALVVNNTGTLTLTAANTFTGNVTVNNGTLAATNTVNVPAGTAGPLGNANMNTRTITVNGPGILDLQINNILGQLSGVGGTKNATPPPVVINGGTLQCEKSSNLVGPLTLNGATVIANCASTTVNYRPAGYLNSYLSYQLVAGVTVTGTSPSIISNSQTSFGAAQDGISLTNGATTFTVADVTGNPNVDLTIQAAIGDVNADYSTSGTKIAGVLVKAGPGTMLLSGLNFYSGGSIISAGTLEAGTTDNQALPAGGSAAYAGLANAAGAFGMPGTTITLGDANTTFNNSSPSLLISGAFAVNHPIVVANQSTTGTYTIGGSTDNNASFGGAITLNQPLTVSQVVSTVGNVLTVSGGITAGSGPSAVTFAGPGNINVTTTPIVNGGGTLGVNVTGATLTLSTANTYTGNTTISAGSLNLSGSASLASPNIVVGGGAKFDVSGTAGFTLVSQTLSNSTSTATLAGNISTASGTVSLTYAAGTPSFTVTNGTLTLSSATVFKVNNTGAALVGGSYKLISTNLNGSGFIAGTAPTLVSVGGNGLAGGATASLQINSGELYLNVTGSSVNTHAGPLQVTITGSTLQIGWPTNIGWTLLTNSVDLANSSDWYPYPSSTTLTNVYITLDPGKTNVFFRLVYPYP